ncbi:Rtt10 protein [Maudiozyma humilis]|uniref:Rtt10 protein n=1 Tax=Maudiozyma humilis TaxID=51915 RepID=A0AAV5S4K6_MAUHU|nr:Rtt10 protein [Kazachstania humilis]
MSGELKDIAHYGPALCVKFSETYPQYTFVAMGPFMQVYNYKTGELINRARVFSANKVHGFNFSKDGAMCVLYGSKSIAFCKTQDLLTREDFSKDEKMFAEWITDAAFSFTGEQVYILTCYNLVVVTDLEGNIQARRNLKNERSILYSGSIKVLSEERVLINAGTVFGGVLIWDLLKQEKIHNLTGHEGSIFYVVVSNNGKYVASCSDDRSIRLWDMESGKQLSIGWGHTARIWNLKFFNNDSQLISVSEDCTCRIWDVVAESGATSLVMKNIYETHLIKNVWGVDVNETEALAVTSGNDGRVKLIDLKQTSRVGDEVRSFNITNLPSNSPLSIEKGEIFKGFYWFNFGLVAITSLGNILKFTEATGTWEILMRDERLVSYSLTHGISTASGNVALFANNKCDLLLLNFSKDGQTIKSKNSLHLDNLSKSCNTMITAYQDEYCLVTVESPNPRDKFAVLQLNVDTLEIVHEFNFAKPDNFVSSCLAVYQQYLIVGGRFGAVAIFDMRNTDADAYVMRQLCPGDTTTSIEYIEERGADILLSVTNRDGFYNFTKVNLDKLASREGIAHEIIHSNKVMKGFLEGAFYNESGEYITYGFKSSLFYMYNEKNCYEIASEVCGGAHRQWKLCDLGDGQGYMLVYIKAAELYMRKIYTAAFPETLESGLHGREIRDISIMPERLPWQYSPENGYLFVTGSEDTTVRLGKYSPETGAVVNYWMERRHVSGLQRLRFISDSLVVSCSAREELFLWTVNTEFQSNPYMHIRQTLPTQSTHPDLRIMDFDVLFNAAGTGDFALATVYSDSSIKVWWYSNASNGFIELWSNRYQTCCILNTSFVVLQGRIFLLIAATDGYLSLYDISREVDILHATEDTRTVRFVNEAFGAIASTSGPAFTLRVHKSGIKTMDVARTKAGAATVRVVTGGDDNAISLTQFNCSASGELSGTVCSMVSDAASSTVTSTQLLPGATQVLSTSVDQRVRLWDITPDNQLSLRASKYTTNADTGCCDIVQTENSHHSLLIAGVGLSVWKC